MNSSRHSWINQAKEIVALKEQLGGVSKAIEQKADTKDVIALETVEVVNSKSKNVTVSLYGQVNRAVLWSENGDSSKVSFVDNSNSQSRIGINASASPVEGLSVGGKIEYGVKSNASSDISQNVTNDTTSVNWNLHHADIFITSDSLGKISLGHGSAASDGTSEVDLSGTSVVPTLT